MAKGDEQFCENYHLIKPEKATCFDLIRILCSSDLDKRDFFKSRLSDKVTSFRHRWIIFISVLVQKILLFLKKPMAIFGNVVEQWLNYPAANGGYRRLFSNILTDIGNVVKPDKSSAKFISLPGKVDERIDLDNKISKSDRRYNTSLSAMASKLSYENEAFIRNVVTNHWQMEMIQFDSFWNDYQEDFTTHAFIFQDTNIDSNLIVVAFRGTEPFDADSWRTDIDLSWYEFRGIGKIHGGFMKALGLQKSKGWPKDIRREKPFAYYTIREKLKTLIQENKDARFILTGHSLGGALAILFASILTIHEEELLLERLEGVYTFGQPRVGNEQFGEYMKRKMNKYDVKYFRHVYCNDIVPRLPYDNKTFLFKHFGSCLYFNSCYEGQVLEEEPNKNYFSFMLVVPHILNAIYELIRSFFLAWKKGREYKEGWLMRMFRVVALFAPGLIDHFTLEYINITRLGKLPTFVNPMGPKLN